MTRDGGTVASVAYDILERNRFTTIAPDGTQHEGTTPSPEYYFNAWLWDGMFLAKALSRTDPNRALAQIKLFIAAQWENGHIGHIAYRSEPTPYFPGQEVWRTEGRSKSGIISSGIIQPPIVSLAVRHLYENTRDEEVREELVRKILPAVERFHDYLHETHDPECSGLISIFHPWATGSDNSNAFDIPLEAIREEDIPEELVAFVLANRVDHLAGDPETRPTHLDYLRFFHLLDLGGKLGWDYRHIAKEFPFAVKDVSVNSLWCYANDELGKLLVLVGREKDAQKYFRWADETRQAISRKMWDLKNGGFDNVNVAKNRAKDDWEPYYTERFANFMPFLTGDITSKQLNILLGKLRDPQMYWTDYPVPSVPPDHQDFDLKRYWRGPTWPAINYFIIVGLRNLLLEPRHQYTYEQKVRIWETQHMLIDKTRQMIEENGFYENFNPTKGEEQQNGNGFSEFSWTAAVYQLILGLEDISLEQVEQLRKVS